MAQLIAQDERPLPAFAGFEVPVGNGLVEFRSADTGKCASFRNRKPFALNGRRWLVHDVSIDVRMVSCEHPENDLNKRAR